MKIRKYWRTEQALAKIGQQDVRIRCWGGSNFSEEDAVRDALDKIGKLRRKLAGEVHVFDDYEVEIREEVVQMLDEKSIVTRNRYGALVLNVEDLMIMDIDRPPFSLWDMLRSRSVAKDKERIAKRVRELARKPTFGECSFRIYETGKGIRVMVLGRTFDPASRESQSMMKEFGCDPLYMLLCRRQACFRARLTPKPSRMRLRGHRVRFPRTQNEEESFRQWLAEYEAASRNFVVCRLVEQIGSKVLPEAVQLHDQICGIGCSGKLA